MKRKLDRATYFELKVKGINDAEIIEVFSLSANKLCRLRSAWRFTGIKTKGFQKMMKRAKAGQAYVKGEQK